MDKNNKDKKKGPLNTALALSGIGIQMGLTIYLGAKLGNWLDEQYVNDGNWYTKGVTLLAVVISFYHLISQVNQINK